MTGTGRTKNFPVGLTIYEMRELVALIDDKPKGGYTLQCLRRVRNKLLKTLNYLESKDEKTTTSCTPDGNGGYVIHDIASGGDRL